VLEHKRPVRGILSSRGPSGYILESFLGRGLRSGPFASIIAESKAFFADATFRARPSFNAEDSHEIFAALVEASHIASGTYHVDLVPTDTKDNHIVSTALEGGADTIVTEDARDLLSLKVIKIRGFSTRSSRRSQGIRQTTAAAVAEYWGWAGDGVRAERRSDLSLRT